MTEDTKLQHELHHAHRRIAELERLWARDQALLQSTHADLHAIQSTYGWKLAQAFYALRNRILPPTGKVGAWFDRFVGAAVRILRNGVRRLRSRHQPGGRLGMNVTIDDSQYHRWIRRHEPRLQELLLQRNARHAFEPMISVLMPVYRPPLRYLRFALDSLLNQTYANWEACLADASNDATISAMLEEYTGRDPRFRLIRLATNDGIAGNTNAALAQARGEFVAFLDHDDDLAPFALFEIATALNAQADADVLYSDEDKRTESGTRVEPHFKPDWSPEYLQSLNYICHLLVLRRELAMQVGGLRPGYEGAQDYDLVLRATAAARRIVHIPKILYHWRMHAASTAHSSAAKPDAALAGQRALADHFDQSLTPASVDCRSVPGIYRVRHHLPVQPRITVIIANRDQPEMLRQCLATVESSGYENLDWIIVENGSTQAATWDLYREWQARPRRKVVTWEKPFNFAAVNNFAADQADGELLLFLNNDISSAETDWLHNLAALAMQPEVGAVGAKLRYPDGMIQHGGIILGMGGIAGHTHLDFPGDAPGYMRRLQFTHNCAAVTAACMLVPKSVFDEVGGFDEGFVLAFNDVDLCMRIREAGYRIVWMPDAELVHHESKTRGYEDTPAKKLRFQQEVELFRRKWEKALSKGDPYFSPHFRLDRCDWVLRD